MDVSHAEIFLSARSSFIYSDSLIQSMFYKKPRAEYVSNYSYFHNSIAEVFVFYV